MSNALSPIPSHSAPSHPAPAGGLDPLTMRLEDLPAYGSPEVEAAPSRTRTFLIALISVAIVAGIWLGLRPYYYRVSLTNALERQIAAGNITAAGTTFERFS
ncbi:MAG: hypothetical protein ABI743_06355, partial [bacterium]